MALFSPTSSMTTLVCSLKNDELWQVREEIEEKEIDVNQEINGRYPLHYAAEYGNYDIVAYLLKQGARVDVTDNYGVTPLLGAIWEGRTDCVRLLLEHGASKEGLTPDGKTYLEVAEKQEIKDLLLKSQRDKLGSFKSVKIVCKVLGN